MMYRVILASLLVLAVVVSANDALPHNAKNLHVVPSESRFAEEPQYHVPKMIPAAIDTTGQFHPRFAQQFPVLPNHRLVPGQGAPAGHYYHPQLQFRWPSFPFDNPSYSSFPQMYPIPLPPAWRSDAMGIMSDGARYLENMDKYDYYGPYVGTLGSGVSGTTTGTASGTGNTGGN